MLGQIDGGYRPRVKVTDEQLNCLHDWQHNELIVPPQPSTCTCCKRKTLQRARIHCPKCLTTAGNLCGPYYYNMQVPTVPAVFFPNTLIEQQNYYISWCSGEIERLKKEVAFYKDKYEELLLEKELRQDFQDLG